MKTSRINSFWTAWLKCFGRGLHALVAMMVSGFVVQIVLWMIEGLISAILGKDGQPKGTISEMVFSIACFGLVGLPLFGFLFAITYSPSEPGDVASQAASPNRSAAPNLKSESSVRGSEG